MDGRGLIFIDFDWIIFERSRMNPFLAVKIMRKISLLYNRSLIPIQSQIPHQHVHFLNKRSLRNNLDQCACINRIITFLNIQGKVHERRLFILAPFQDKLVVLVRDLSVIEDTIAHLIAEDVLEVAKNELSV